MLCGPPQPSARGRPAQSRTVDRLMENSDKQAVMGVPAGVLRLHLVCGADCYKAAHKDPFYSC